MPGSRRAVTPGMPRAAGPTRTKPFPFATQPFATQPFATQPFATQPPLVTRPLMSQPLVTRPPTRSSMTQPLAAQPPLSQWRPTRLPKRPAPRGPRPAALPARFRGGFRDCGGRSRGLGRAAPETSRGRLRRLPAGAHGDSRGGTRRFPAGDLRGGGRDLGGYREPTSDFCGCPRNRACTFRRGAGICVRSCSVLSRGVHEHVGCRWTGGSRNLPDRGAMDRNHTIQPDISGPAPTAAEAGGPSRRQVLRGAAAGLGAAALVPVLGMAGSPASAQARVTARASGSRSTDFGQDWKFVLVNPEGITDPTGAYSNAQDPAFDDSGWRTLDVPHDWSIELTPVQTASTSSGTGFLQGGLAWYRKHFTLPSSLAGQRISIEFDGVYMNSNVY